MTISTQFNYGDEVFIMEHNSIRKVKVAKVRVEQGPGADKNPLVIYNFDYPNGHGGHEEFYRYEMEVGSSAYELFRKIAGKDANPSAGDSDGGVTDDLVALQKFVRFCNLMETSNEDVKAIVQEARKLLVI